MDLNKLTEIAIQASQKAGKEILKYYKVGVSSTQKDKDKHDSPLTIADKKAHQAIKSFLSKKSSLPILSEESKLQEFEERKKWKRFWLVDPLDGTKEFLKENDEFTVNVALIDNMKPVIGVVYAPALYEMYFANKDHGSFRISLEPDEKFNIDNAEKLIVDKSKLSKKKIKAVVSRSYLSEETEEFLEQLQKDYKEPIERVSFGSSLKFCRVAENKADIYPNLGNKSEWDIGAGHAVLKFAGGDVRDFADEKELFYNKEDILTPHFVAT